MQTAKLYKGRQTTTKESHHLSGCVLYALMTGFITFVVLLFLLSLVEWFLPNTESELMPYIADAIPFISIWLGTYLGSYRLGRTALLLGVISGLICWLIGVCMAWCVGIAVTIEWIIISAALCGGTALIGAMMGLLRVR